MTDACLYATRAELQALCDEVNALTENLAGAMTNLLEQQAATAMVVATINAILVKEFGLDREGTMKFVASFTDDPNILAHARAIVGGRPKLVVIPGGKP